MLLVHSNSPYRLTGPWYEKGYGLLDYSDSLVILFVWMSNSVTFPELMSYSTTQLWRPLFSQTLMIFK